MVMGWIISWANGWVDYSNYFGEGVGIYKNWATTDFLVFKKIFLTIISCGHAGSSLLCRPFFSCGPFFRCGERGLLSGCCVRTSHRGGFCCCRARALGLWASVAVARGFSSGTTHVGTTHTLDHRINSCGMQALLFHSMWDLPGPGMEPISPIGRLILYPESPRKLHFLVFDDQPWNCPDPGGCGI